MTPFADLEFGRRFGQTLGRVQNGEVLTRGEAAALLGEILDTTTPIADAYWVALFAAVQARGAKQQEILGFVDAALDYDGALSPSNSAKISLPSGALHSIVGSGKDSWKTFNISTTASFIAAACGLTIFKPTSQALSSVTGATDLLRHLDVPELSELDQVGELLEREGLAFLDFSHCVPRYAERYRGRFFQFHPLSYIMPPLAIPFRLDGIVYGIADPRTEFCLDILGRFGFANSAVVTTRLDGRRIIDEFIPYGEATFSLRREGVLSSWRINHLAPVSIAGIAHRGSHVANAEFVLKTLHARKETPAVRAAAMAAAAILVTAGRAENLDSGYRSSLEAVLDGSASNVLTRYREAVRRAVRPIGAINCEAFPPAELVKKAKEAQRQIDAIAGKFGYQPVAEATQLRGVMPSYLAARFTHGHALERFDEAPVEDQAIVTGFGPTNAPTAGTLSVMLKTLSLQARIGCAAEFVVSDLGAFLSRNRDWSELRRLARIFERFIAALAGERQNLAIRTHIDKGNLGLASFINEELLRTAEFLQNKEATELLYEHLGLLGNCFGVITDATYTVSDILKPFFPPDVAASAIHLKRRVLVVAGLEEHYFPRLASIALARLKERHPDRFAASDSAVSALYTQIIPGFAPYPKMSKSIPESGLTLEDSPQDIYRKIVDASEANEPCVFEMMTQASEWDDDRLAKAAAAFAARSSNRQQWRQVCLAYAEEFHRYCTAWETAKSVRDSG